MNDERWLRLFVGFTLFSIIFAGMAYYVQFEIVGSFEDDPHAVKFNFIRLLRMISCYVIPVVIFTRITDQSLTDLGLQLQSRKNVVGLFLGIFIYVIASIIFVKYGIFVHLWRYTPWFELWLNLISIGLMAAITDFWTRGFILFQLSKKYGDLVAIIGQNVVWFSIHVYEIFILVPYIGLLGANLLTLFLGISGDLVALKSNNIWGLMMGHILLNLVVMLTGKGVLF